MRNGSRVSRLAALLTFSIIKPRPGHSLAEAAFFDEFPVERFQLLIDQVIRLVDQADCDVGNDLRRPGFEEFAKVLEGQRSLFAQAADVERFAGVFLPEGKVSGPQVVLVVVEQFLEAATSDVCEVDLELF